MANNFPLKAYYRDFIGNAFSLKCPSEVQFLTERKLLTGAEEVETAWITTDLSFALPCMLGDGRLAYMTH